MADEPLRVEGVRELIKALRKAGRDDLIKEMGQSNKLIGQEVIQRLQPLPATVGLGAGARVRPSASARLVQLKAGGAHRSGAVPQAQWGRRPVRRTSKRPYIVGTAIRTMPKIEQIYMAGIARAMQEIGEVK